MTENGRVQLKRIRWTVQDQASSTPIDGLLDEAEKSFTCGIREMLCRLNQSSSSFAKTAVNFGRLSSIEISGESVRQLVEYEGRKVTNELTRGSIGIGWSAKDCTLEDVAQTSVSSATSGTADEQQKPKPTRVYVGCDGVKVPVVTQAEKTKRRATIKLKRRRSGKKCRPLPAARAGSDQQYKEAGSSGDLVADRQNHGDFVS